MSCALESIQQITKGEKITHIQKVNRYGVATKLDQGNREFYFSTPIYSEQSEIPGERRFMPKGSQYILHGSSAQILITEFGIKLLTVFGSMRVCWEEKKQFTLCDNGRFLRSEKMSVHPTFNGVLVRQVIDGGVTLSFESDLYQEGEIKSNSKFFAYMKSKYEPFFTMGAMYAESASGQEFYGLTMKTKRENAKKISVEMKSEHSDATRFVWEANAYESKLFQDTTVESKRPSENNVFGSVAHLGKSPEYGTQYLYSRLDLAKLPVESKKNIKSVYLHIPYYIISGQSFRVFMPFKRFCSFGSRWNNKVAYEGTKTEGHRQGGFVSFDLSPYFLNEQGAMQETAGIMIRQITQEGFSVLATADNYFTPQILEIRHNRKEK